MKSGILILLEPSGPVRACHGIALPFTSYQQRTVLLQSKIFLTYICLNSRLFCMTLGTVPHHTWRHTGAIVGYWYVYRVSRDAFRSFSKRYPSYALRKHICGRGRGTKKTRAVRCSACYYSTVFTRIGCTLLTCDMYMSDLRHTHDPVLSSLKMEGIRLLFLVTYLIWLWLKCVCMWVCVFGHAVCGVPTDCTLFFFGNVFDPEDEDITIFRNVKIYSTDYTFTLYQYMGWSKSLWTPDNCIVIIRCTETFW
jgi:hypothetical protein